MHNEQKQLIEKLHHLNFHGPYFLALRPYMVYYGHLLALPALKELNPNQLTHMIHEVNQMVSSDDKWQQEEQA